MNTSALARFSSGSGEFRKRAGHATITPCHHRRPGPSKSTMGQSWPYRVTWPDHGRSRRYRGRVVRVKALAVAVGVVGLLSLAGCDNGGGGKGSGALTTSERKYCSLVKQFKSHMPTISRDADPQQFAAEMSASLAR